MRREVLKRLRRFRPTASWIQSWARPVSPEEIEAVEEDLPAELRGMVQRLVAVLTGPRSWATMLALGALAYLVTSADVVPDFLVGLGWADDLIVMRKAFELLVRRDT